MLRHHHMVTMRSRHRTNIILRCKHRSFSVSVLQRDPTLHTQWVSSTAGWSQSSTGSPITQCKHHLEIDFQLLHLLVHCRRCLKEVSSWKTGSIKAAAWERDDWTGSGRLLLPLLLMRYDFKMFASLHLPLTVLGTGKRGWGGSVHSRVLYVMLYFVMDFLKSSRCRCPVMLATLWWMRAILNLIEGQLHLRLYL